MYEAHKDLQKLHKDSICEYFDDLRIEESSRDDIVFEFKLVELRLFDSSQIQRDFYYNLFAFSQIIVRLLGKV